MFENLDDPKKQLLMMMGLGLLGGAPGQRKNFGADLGHAGLLGLQGYGQAKQGQARSAEQKQAQEMRDMQMAQMRQQQEASQSRQGALGQLAQQRPDLAPLLQLAPEMGLKRAFPEPVKPKMGFAPDGRAVDMNALEPGGNYAKQPEWKDPAYQDFQMKRAQAGASRVSVDNRQENEFNKKIGSKFADNYNDILTSGQAAQGKFRDLQRFESIVSKVPTGKLEPLKAEVGRLGASLGVKVDTEKLGFQDALESLSNQFALQMRNPQGGAGMPGAMSDKDREFLVATVPGLSKTPGGNKLILEAFKRVSQREMEIAKLARAYKAKTGRFDEGFYEVLAQEFGSKDMLGDLTQAAAQSGASDPLGIRR